MTRDVYVAFQTEHGEEHYYTKKENEYRRKLYKKTINICCHPDCASDNPSKLETHHIIPIGKGGTDDYVNFIVLCQHCHKTKRLHSHCYDKQLELLTYKIYKEIMILGKSSDEMSNHNFSRFLVARKTGKPFIPIAVQVIDKNDYETKVKRKP